jgi:hypothetical protein
MRGRGALIGAAIVALPIAGLWWLATALLAGDHSACNEVLSADLAFAASNVGIVLAIAALVSAARRALRTGWVLLAVYVVLLAMSVGVSLFAPCE